LKRILLILGATLTLTIAAACGQNAGSTSSFPVNTTGPTLAPTPSEMPTLAPTPSEMPSEMPSDMPSESPAAS